MSLNTFIHSIPFHSINDHPTEMNYLPLFWPAQHTLPICIGELHPFEPEYLGF